VSKVPRKVACPACGTLSVFSPDNPFRPFCSERCRVADLGGWATEGFRIPGKPVDGSAGPDEEGPGS
jgi:endogenous inhibitor of DNA gyrase (YacG/DUF329 family)